MTSLFINKKINILIIVHLKTMQLILEMDRQLKHFHNFTKNVHDIII